MQARTLVGAAVATGAVAFAVRRGVHRRIGKQVVKVGTAIREGLESRALAFAINHMADGLVQTASTEIKTPPIVVDPPVILSAPTDKAAEGEASDGTDFVELADEVDELPER